VAFRQDGTLDVQDAIQFEASSPTVNTLTCLHEIVFET
jgi:hypothetical protein